MSTQQPARPTLCDLHVVVGLIDQLLVEAYSPRPRLHVPPRAVDALQKLLLNEINRPRPGPPSVAKRLEKIGKAFARPL